MASSTFLQEQSLTFAVSKTDLCAFLCMEPFHFKSDFFLLLLLSLPLFLELFSVNCSALGQCLPAESSALLQLKQGFTSGKLETWRQGTDYCIWEGVTCDESRRVTGLDLSELSIAGKIDPSLFNLTSLGALNFASNQFYPMPIPDSGWERLANLASLNLSNAGFVGKVPTSISRLSRLTSLDLSYQFELYLPNNPTFLRNMSYLRELNLDRVNLSAYGDEWCGALFNNTPLLEALSLDSCSLSGASCSSLFKLPFLAFINLGGNHLESSILDSFINFTLLSDLRLGFNEFKGIFPNEIFQLRNLNYLDISYNPMLSGSLPDFPKDSNLKTMVLSDTNFSGNLPETIGNLKLLTDLRISNCLFSGRMPSSMGNLSQLVWLDLSSNTFRGPVPFFLPVSRISEPILRHNSLYVPGTHICLNGELCNLEKLNLYENSFSGPIPASVFTLPSLKQLQLGWNQFSGQLAELSYASPLLIIVDLSNNKLQGQIPRSLFQISGLYSLSLALNNFSGVVELEFIRDLKNLSTLDLSNSGLSLSLWDADDGSSSSSFSKLTVLRLVACNLTKIPAFIKYQHQMDTLDLSDNRIHGEIPSWLWSIRELNLSCNLFTHVAEPSFNHSVYHPMIIDLHSNMLEGLIPPNIYLHLNFTLLFSLANNSLIGEIPPSICDATNLWVLDLSNNRLTGSIPPCFLDGGIDDLYVLNLRGNQLHGTIPHRISPNCHLHTINLRDNQLVGMLPRSLSNCQSLEILDLGNNNLKDTFPYWLGNISSLRVLVLRSNKFHGLVGPPDRDHETNYTFPMLHVLDISSNNFSGSLCAECFSNFKSMMGNRADTTHGFEYSEGSQYYCQGVALTFTSQYYYQDVLTIMNKRQLMTLQKFWMIFKSIDFSNNRFEGEIPSAIGQLDSLLVLNMSQNHLTGKIPPQLGKLLQLESLDLSLNSLSGEIPQELVSLHFLEYLNLSYNKLVGKIPVGGQFSTFSNTSFEGNEGLHWLTHNISVPGVNDTAACPPSMGDTASKNISYMIVLGILIGVGFGVGMTTVVVIDVMCCDKGRRRNRRPVHG